MSEFSELLALWWRQPIVMWSVIFLGACVGSFLNVAIYRIPRNFSVNNPKRSFCPVCKASLPWWQNLPVVTWLAQRGKCAHCQTKIPLRYLLVESLTAALFYFSWLFFSPLAGLLMMFFCAVLVVVFFIDAEHQVIPTTLTSAAAIIAVIFAYFQPETLDLLSKNTHLSAWLSLWQAALGWLVGFGSLWFVVILGKIIFGRKKLVFQKAAAWQLIEPQNDSEQLAFVIAGERYDWGDLFFRKSDVLRVEGHGIIVDGQRAKITEILIRADEIEFAGKKIALEDLKSLRGKSTRVIIPREAMGMGDPHLLGMIGAFLAWPAVLFTIMMSCFYAIAAAIVARVGFGRPLPYGPFLALGALTWVFGGWRWWAAYLSFLENWPH